jgi:TrmH family RNA methyltransferase
MVLVMGSERQGMPGALLKACKRVVSIPMNGISDSLNIAVATAIILYEVFDQKRKVKQT